MSDEMDIKKEIERQFRIRRNKNISRLLTVLIITFVVLLFLSCYLKGIESRDGVTTSVGDYISWRTHPYETLGNNLLILGVISLLILIPCKIVWR